MARRKSDSLDSDSKISALREFVHCDPETGTLRWARAGKGRKVGKVISPTPTSYGYHYFRTQHISYQAHRVVWAFANGPIPDGMQIDHINGVRDDNRICNLRLVTNQINCQNKRKPQPNTATGILGVAWYKSRNLYTAQIKHNRKTKHLGYFTDPMEAHQAYLEAKRGLHIGCTI